MTNVLTEARQALQVALEAEGLRVYAEVPQMFSPPLCWIAPRDPYRVAGQTFARKRVALKVVCLADVGTNAAALEAADEMASQVADLVDALDGFRLDVDEITVPMLYSSAQGQDCLGAAVNVVAEVTRAD